MSARVNLAALAAIGLCCAFGRAASASPYVITYVPAPSVNGVNTNVNGTGVNNVGQIVGFTNSNFNTGVNTAYTYSNGVLIPLIVPGAVSASAAGVNDLGEIVGSYQATLFGLSHGFIYQNGTYTTLDFPTSGFGGLSGVNNAGQIVGGNVVYTNGVSVTLSVPGSVDTKINGINNSGAVVGTFDVPNVPGGVFSGPTTPGGSFIYQNGVYTIVGAPTPGTVGGAIGLAGINDLGQAVGYQVDATGRSAQTLIYQNGVITDVSLFPAFDTVNFNGINDSGQIVGTVYGPNFAPEAFLATPVPEPSSLALLCLGTAGLALVRRRGRR